jgi:hypothetical protein
MLEELRSANPTMEELHEEEPNEEAVVYVNADMSI